jgi:hypothetical protein
MRPFEIGDDGVRMTVLALPHPTHSRRFGRTIGGNHAPTRVADAGTSKMEDIRTKLEQHAYHVDPQEVADAIVRRLLAGRTVRDGSTAQSR